MTHTKKSGYTSAQCIDAGLAFVLLLLLAMYFWKISLTPWIILAVIALMTIPKLYYPFTWVWFGFSEALGMVTSKIILSILFFLIVTPIALIRRITRSDPMQLRQWKRSNASVFISVEHTYTARDLERPY